MSHTYDIGTRVWRPDPTDGWIGSEVIARQIDGDKVNLIFRLENGVVWHNRVSRIKQSLIEANHRKTNPPIPLRIYRPTPGTCLLS